MHHLCALGSLSKFLSLSPIFCEALLSGVVTFVSFCKDKGSKWTCNFTNLHVKRSINPSDYKYILDISLTWGTVVTLWLLLGDLEARGRSSSSHDSRLLFELLVGWRTNQTGDILVAIKAKMQNCYHCKQTWKYSNKHKPFDGNLPFPQKRNCSVPWWSEILVNCSSHLEY